MKSRLAFIIIVAMVIVSILYGLHNIKKASMTFSEGGMIVGDRSEPYEDGVEGVVADVKREASLDLRGSLRSIYMKFEDADWKDGNLSTIASILRTDYYRVILNIWIYESPITQMNIGDHLEPVISLILFNAYTDSFIGVMTSRVLTPGNYSVVLGGVTLITYKVEDPEPPASLYDDRYLDIVRVDENTWVVKVNAWFTLFQTTSLGETVKHYVKLSFKINISMKSLI